MTAVYGMGQAAALHKLGLALAPLERTLAIPAVAGGIYSGARSLGSDPLSGNVFGDTAAGALSGAALGAAGHTAVNVVDHGLRPGLKLTGQQFAEVAKNRENQFRQWFQNKIK